VLIGAVAGVLVIISANFVEKTLKVDDPVGASSVHGACGIWGVLSVGLFADGSYGDGLNNVAGKVTGLFYGNSSQLAAQCVGIATNLVYVGATTFASLWLIGKLVGNRVSPEDELSGLDIPEMGLLAYPDDAMPLNLSEALEERSHYRE
jgi:Amt family ammonium transporter